MLITRDEAFMVVCEIVTGNEVGTGMFVAVPEGNDTFSGWIITASHVAIKCNNKSIVVLSTQDGHAEVLLLSFFGSVGGWVHHREADISAFRIVHTPENQRIMTGRFFPYSQFNLERMVVSRDYELTSVGFPSGLGTEGLFSPLTFRSYASSGFVTLRRADTKTPSTFFCLENPSVGGYSGCPIFDLGYSFDGIMQTTRGDTICHGIMHGTMSDNTGGKIAMVTPAFYLKDFFGDVK